MHNGRSKQRAKQSSHHCFGKHHSGDTFYCHFITAISIGDNWNSETIVIGYRKRINHAKFMKYAVIRTKIRPDIQETAFLGFFAVFSQQNPNVFSGENDFSRYFTQNFIVLNQMTT